MKELDSNDLEILKILTEDGRETLSELSNQIGLSTSGVRRRMKRLEDDGVIQGYTAKVNPEKAGFDIAAFLDIDVKSSEARRVAGILKRCNKVCEVHRTTGNHGLIAKIRAEDKVSISEFVEDKISTWQGVKDVNITMTMETYKEELMDM